MKENSLFHNENIRNTRISEKELKSSILDGKFGLKNLNELSDEDN